MSSNASFGTNGRTRLVLDTNAAIALLNGVPPVSRLLAGSLSVAVSIITVIELRVGPSSDPSDVQRIDEFIEGVDVISVDPGDADMIDRIIEIRRDHRLKLPDAIIAASAIRFAAVLVTRDRHFDRLPNLVIERF